MKPYSRNNGKIRVRNKSKTNSVSDKDRKNNFKVSNPTRPIDTFAVGGHVIKARFRKLKARGLKKEDFVRCYNDKI